MSLSLRQTQIMSAAQKAEFLAIDALSQEHGVSSQTIRRDVNALCEQGLLRRVWGGVALPPQEGNLVYRDRRVLNVDGKKKIAQLVADHVPDGASVALSIGTTPEVVVDGLLGKRGLKILTNNLNVAMVAARQADWTVTIAGGVVRGGDCDVLGEAVDQFYGAYQVDIGIFGVGGVGPDGGMLDFHPEEVASRQAIARNARRQFLVLDQSKFERRAHVRGGHIRDVSMVFCDAPLPAPIHAELMRCHVGVVIPDEARDGTNEGAM